MPPTFDTLIQDFFCRRLIDQQGVSPRTVEAYRGTFPLLLAYLPQHLRIRGKGRNERVVPLWKPTGTALMRISA
jgi:hypothetical protein